MVGQSMPTSSGSVGTPVGATVESILCLLRLVAAVVVGRASAGAVSGASPTVGDWVEPATVVSMGACGVTVGCPYGGGQALAGGSACPAAEGDGGVWGDGGVLGDGGVPGGVCSGVARSPSSLRSSSSSHSLHRSLWIPPAFRVFIIIIIIIIYIVYRECFWFEHVFGRA